MKKKDAHQSIRAEHGNIGPTVLQVIPQLESGGAERTTLEIARALKAAGGNAIIASARGRMVSDLESAGATIHILPVDSKNPLIMWKNVSRLASIIKQHNIKLVHARSRAPAWSCYFAARRCHVPFISTHHGTYQATSWIKRYYNSIMVRGECVIANSDFIATQISSTYHLPTDKIVVIPRGVDEEAFNCDAISAERMMSVRRMWGITDGEKSIILAPARLTPWKGQTVLIDAVEQLLRSGRRNFICMLLGDPQGRGAFRDELRSLIRDRQLSDMVKMPGFCNDMPAAYAVSSVVVSPAIRPEAFGRVAIEAQAMGKPVIVSDHGGARETVIDGETGWRVAPGDSKLLAQIIEKALSMSAETKALLSKTARAHVHRAYSAEQMCAKTIALYRTLTDGMTAADKNLGG